MLRRGLIWGVGLEDVKKQKERLFGDRTKPRPHDIQCLPARPLKRLDADTCGELDVIVEKIETGTDELRFKPCRIPQIFESVLPIVEPAVRSAGVSIIEDFPAALPRLLVDEPAMNKIVINLLTNAIKYNKRGGSVTITADCPSDGPFTLIVEDTGIGIAAEDMDKILEPFQRGESPLVKSREGTGLGLNIVKRLIDQHDATITFHSTPNVGTRVAVSFPPERIVRSSLPDHVNTTAAAPVSFAI